MSTPLLSHLFNHYFGTPHDFVKVEKKPLETHLARLATISIHPDTQKGQFIYPIIDDNMVYVRLSTFKALREHCADNLGTLPDKQDRILREFLIYSEALGVHPAGRDKMTVTFLAPVVP